MLVDVSALERLQLLDTLRKRRSGMKQRKLAPPTVSEPLGERPGVRDGGQLDTPCLLFGQGPPETGFDLRVQGVLQHSQQLGEKISYVRYLSLPLVDTFLLGSQVQPDPVRRIVRGRNCLGTSLPGPRRHS
ncbi:hypothetical protein OG530_14425 [Streptomyces decoyicus]|uniref:hypothetical protein n=1 Tax=Streptomyces decoyicus TaxID=249567 RepID=UPI002E19D43D